VSECVFYPHPSGLENPCNWPGSGTFRRGDLGDGDRRLIAMSTNVVDRRLLTKREVAAFYRKSERTVDRYVAAGVLRPIRLVPRGRLLFRIEDVEELVK
jgi:Helix-turn-helix domain